MGFGPARWASGQLKGACVPQYAIYFNQQWVGDHSEESFRSRGPLARTVVEEMSAAGVLVAAGGLEEDIDAAFWVESIDGIPRFHRGPHAVGAQFLGGLTIVEVDDEDTAASWAGRIAEACGWPQEVRRFKG